MAIRRIGQILVDMGFIDDDQLEMLLEEQQQQPGEKLGKIAEEMGLITDDQLAQALAEQMNLQVINLTEANSGTGGAGPCQRDDGAAVPRDPGAVSRTTR